MAKLRQLAPGDADLFRSVRLLGLQESPTAFGASYAQEVQMPTERFAERLTGTPDRWVIGAFSEDALIGMIGFIRDAGEKMRHKGNIWGMYVVPEHRQKRVGRALLQEAIARLELLPGLRVVRLSVVTSNHVAIRLYEAFGFVRYAEEPDALCVDGTFYSEFHMARTR